jgi:hypothetical protein
MKNIPMTREAPVVRVDFGDEAGWEAVCEEIGRPGEFGLEARVAFVDDRAFEGVTAERLLDLIPNGFGHTFVIVADRATFASAEHPLLLIDLSDMPGRTFRAVPAQVQVIENNLSIANMDFAEFADAVEGDGVFRGYAEG